MLEPTRSRYLAALGIDIYVPRAVLPGALVSPPCEWEALSTGDIAEPARRPELNAPASALKAAPPISAPLIDTVRKPVQPIPVRTPRNPDAIIPKFALSVVLAANGVLLIDDAPPTSAIRNEYQRLLGGFLQAVNSDPQFALEIFFWPLRNSSPIAQDENAAKETLAAYLQKQIQQRSIKTVLLLGAVAQRWVALDDAQLRYIRSNSLLGCLSDPSLKRQLWNDVRELSVR
jgi:hypothetical protein